MVSHTQQILAHLNPYWDYVARRPITPATLSRLENGLRMGLPACLRHFLDTVGLFQDLTNSPNNPILVFETISEYVAARRDLLEGLYGEVDMKLLPFGHNGAGDVYALLALPDGDAQIYFMSQEATAAEDTGQTFDGWLERIVAETLAYIGQRLPNQHKIWQVQFTFRGADFDTILSAMQQAGAVALPDDWELVETAPSGVRKSTARIALDGKPLIVRRLEYPHWVTPWYFIDMAEPLDLVGQASTIQRLDDLFYERLPGYGFLSFGAALPASP
jgi:hypothetical protein